ncbi:MAG: hypothetical protein ACKVQB_09480 [Bacteroidia bacterium]
MKILISIILLICLIAPITGTYIWLKYEKKQTKHEVKRQMIAGMDKNELVLLKFTRVQKETTLRWKHCKEFEFKGQMYDIVERELKGDSIFYRCWWDNTETKLNKKLDRLVSEVLGGNQQNKDNNKRLIQFFKSLYHSKEPNETVSFKITCRTNFISNSENYFSYNSAPLTPPPQFFLKY